jgi:hypothetical protein
MNRPNPKPRKKRRAEIFVPQQRTMFLDKKIVCPRPHAKIRCGQTSERVLLIQEGAE